MSVEKHLCSSQGYHFQFMPQMEEEATMTMHNRIPVPTFKYRDDVKTLFFTESVKAEKYNYWYCKLKIVMWKIDKNMAEAEESDAIGLNIPLEFMKNPRKNFLPPQNQMNPAPYHMRPWLRIQPS